MAYYYCAAEFQSFLEDQFARDKQGKIIFPLVHLTHPPHFAQTGEPIPGYDGPDPIPPIPGLVRLTRAERTLLMDRLDIPEADLDDVLRQIDAFSDTFSAQADDEPGETS